MSVKERSYLFRSLLSTKISIKGKKKLVQESRTNKLPDIPQYQLVKRLGVGGMATVYHAIKISTGRHVAVKIISDSLPAQTNWLERFIDEAKNLAELSHPNIVPVFDWGSHKGTSYIEMELMKGGDLYQWFKTHKVTIADVVKITKQIASGMDFAGTKNIVHRDIKPDNILFREHGTPCISDFGIAKKISSVTTISSQGMVIGTGAYLSPEQANPQGRTLDQRSDLYSLGVLFYEMLSSARPFEYSGRSQRESFLMYLNAHINLPPPPLPISLEAFQPVIDKLLAKDPNERYTRGNELIAALDSITSLLSPSQLNMPVEGLVKHDIPAPDTNTDEFTSDQSGSTVVVPHHQRAARPGFILALPASVVLAVILYIALLPERHSTQNVRITTGGTAPGSVTAHKIQPVEQDTSVRPQANPTESKLQNLISQANSYTQPPPTRLDDLADQIKTFMEILSIESGNKLARDKLNSIRDDQIDFVNTQLRQRELSDLEPHIDLLRLVDKEQASEFEKALESQQQRLQHLKQQDAEIRRLISSATDSSTSSRNSLC